MIGFVLIAEGIGFHIEDFHTLAGFVLAQLQHVPKPGEGFDLAGYCFEVVKMDGHRIVHVNVIRTPRAETAGETTGEPHT